MNERLFISVAIFVGLALLWLGWQAYKGKLIQSIRAQGTLADRPTLLYFTGEYCAVCKFQQSPILATLAAQFGETLTIKEYDAAAHPELTQTYKVLTLPTTVILDKMGRVLEINYGLAKQEKLTKQLSKAVNFQPYQPLTNDQLQNLA
jgi:thioredoxin 1